QSDRKSEPLAIGGYTSLEKVYSFNPIPAELPADLRHFILGGQANLWTEYIADWQQVEYMIFPRIIALSEALWCQGERDYTHFKERLEKFELPYLESKNVNYSKAIFYLESEIVPLSDGVDVEFEAADEKSTIEITFDKSAIGVSEKDGIVKIQKTKRPKLVRLLAKSKTILGTDTVGVQILQHRTLGQPWLLDTKPSPSYQGKEGLTLSDGIIGGRPWNGKEWLGFDQKEVKMTIELNAKEKLNGINLSFLQAESSWIHIPEKVVLEYSTNGSRWKSKELKISKEKNRFTIGKKAKFIRLTIVSMEKIPDGQPGSGHAPWMFMDEVYFD
ncbi:MAG: family 20 glycosylhydrolase, partial [Bacteroidota bacterium]